MTTSRSNMRRGALSATPMGFEIFWKEDGEIFWKKKSLSMNLSMAIKYRLAVAKL
jgi:hypothetical protein